MRKLAERTTKATQEIAQVIDQVQQETRMTVEGMQSITPRVASGRDKVTAVAGTPRRPCRSWRMPVVAGVPLWREMQHVSSAPSRHVDPKNRSCQRANRLNLRQCVAC